MVNEFLELPILIIGFQRVNSLKTLINECLRQTNSKIYISMDGPPDSNSQSVFNARELVESYKSKFPNRIVLRQLSDNVGSAVNMITALDWFFSSNSKGVVLEDDCIPHKDFFQYAVSALEFIKHDDSIWFVSGFRPLIKELEEFDYVLCTLPLNWGWGTTQDKWSEIRELLFDPRIENLFISFLKGPSRVFWNVGYRRIINGWIDAWDTAIAFIMVQQCKFTLIPNCNLVSNIGTDEFALNTKNKSIFLNSTTTSWDGKEICIYPEDSHKVNKEVYKIMIGIRNSHAILPIAKYWIQKLFKLHKNFGDLHIRLAKYKSEESYENGI